MLLSVFAGLPARFDDWSRRLREMAGETQLDRAYLNARRMTAASALSVEVKQMCAYELKLVYGWRRRLGA